MRNMHNMHRLFCCDVVILHHDTILILPSDMRLPPVETGVLTKQWVLLCVFFEVTSAKVDAIMGQWLCFPLVSLLRRWNNDIKNVIVKYGLFALLATLFIQSSGRMNNFTVNIFTINQF